MKYLLQLVELVGISFQRSALLNIYLVTFRFALLGPKEGWKKYSFPKLAFHSRLFEPEDGTGPQLWIFFVPLAMI